MSNSGAVTLGDLAGKACTGAPPRQDPLRGAARMADDDEKPAGESAVPSGQEPVPFVQNEDSSHLVALMYAQRQRWHMNASLYMNNNPPLPLLLSGKVLYVDFGFTSVREYWDEVAEPAYQRFVNDETRANAIMACSVLWPLQ